MNLSTIRNFTPHEINVALPELNVILPSEGIARCATTSESVGFANEVPLTRTRYGVVTGLPEPAEGVLLVVSLVVRLALPHRLDLASPAALVRDGAGKVVGCGAFDVV